MEFVLITHENAGSCNGAIDGNARTVYLGSISQLFSVSPSPLNATQLVYHCNDDGCESREWVLLLRQIYTYVFTNYIIPATSTCSYHESHNLPCLIPGEGMTWYVFSKLQFYYH